MLVSWSEISTPWSCVITQELFFQEMQYALAHSMHMLRNKPIRERERNTDEPPVFKSFTPVSLYMMYFLTLVSKILNWYLPLQSMFLAAVPSCCSVCVLL